MADKTAQLNKKTGKATAVQPVAKQLVRAHARRLRIAPRKMRLVTNLVRNMRVNDAMTQLQFVNKKGAKMLQKLLQSAQANAENNFSLNRDNMFIKEITTDMGSELKRSFPRARGSASIIRRKMSHVNVVLEERDVKPKKKKAVVAKLTKPTSKTKMEKLEKADKAVNPESEVIETPAAEVPKVKETHHENESDVVKQETSPQNLNK